MNSHSMATAVTTPAPVRPPVAPWRCPVCHDALRLDGARRRWACPSLHSFDVARQGYVHLHSASQRRSRHPGDSAEMVHARHRFLATGAYEPISLSVAERVRAARPAVVLDVGCGDGCHTRHVTAPLVLGVDVAKPAIALAAKAHCAGWYAVASAADLPVDDGAADVALSVFGPVFADELARVVRRDGIVVAVHPGPAHLSALRALVYADARPHEVKPPLRTATTWFSEIASTELSFPVRVDTDQLGDLFAMTPYRWHAPSDIAPRLAAASRGHLEVVANVVVTTYRRTAVMRDRPMAQPPRSSPPT